jgi:tetratricopeptide (TPR) repeat protein
MIKCLNIFLVFLLSSVFGQNIDGDTFFLDMGVVIKSGENFDSLRPLSNETQKVKLKNIIQKKEPGSVYMSTTSDMISSLDRITNQVADIEKDFENKLEKLELENSILRNQVNVLKQKLNVGVLDNRLTEADLAKPVIESFLPPELLSRNNNLVEVIDTQDDELPYKIKLKSFDEKIYTEGVIHYNNEEFDECIKALSKLPFQECISRNSKKALFLLADSYEKIGRYKQALTSLEKLALFNDSTYSELILFKKGIIYRDIGMRNKAEKVFQVLVDFYPNSAFKVFAEQEIQNI